MTTRFNLKYCTLEVKDGGSNTLEIHLGDGTISWDEKRNLEYKLDRGKLDDVLQGDEAPLEVKLEFKWTFLKSVESEPVTPKEALTAKGAASSWVSVDSDTCRPYAVDLVLTYHPPCTAEEAEVYTFPQFRHDSFGHDTKGAQISVVGRCNVTEATLARISQSSAGGF